MSQNDTICALATALGESAINIIRISGSDAIPIASSILSGVKLEEETGGTIHHAYVTDGNKKIDEVLVSLFRAPRSYTTEDVVEINTHGGAYVTEKVIELLLQKGCRAAEPGEFTKRAFLNGRIDLSEAESVMDMVSAKTQNALTLANKGLSGEIYRLVSSLRKEIEDILLHISVNIDYPEYTDELKVTKDLCIEKTENLIAKINQILSNAETMRVYKEGIDTVILGKPNVGKSSLLNALINENKAIVTDVSGTTRDIVEGELNLGGIILHLLDTAGIRDTSDPVEKIGIEKSMAALNQAELVLLVIDHGTGIDDEDLELLKLTNNKRRIVIANKADISKEKMGDFPYLDVSALTKDGLPLLEKEIKKLFVKEGIKDNSESIISSSRHIDLLNKALNSLISSRDGAKRGDFLDMIAIDLKDAYDDLGLITGETESDELVDELFKKFCLGK